MHQVELTLPRGPLRHSGVSVLFSANKKQKLGLSFFFSKMNHGYVTCYMNGIAAWWDMVLAFVYFHYSVIRISIVIL